MSKNLEHTINLQRVASDPRNSVWVSASAGCGKTKILVDRVLRLLLSGVKADKILCLTFTNVAAAEMQERIMSELANWILCSDEDLKKKLFNLSGNEISEKDFTSARSLFCKIADENSKIKIQTIHSFCQSLIKLFPFECDVNPAFEIIEKSQEKLFLKQAQNNVLEDAIYDLDLENIIKKISSNLHEESLNQLVVELLEKKEKFYLLKENFFGIEFLISEIFKKFSVLKEENEENIFTQFLSKIDRSKISDLCKALENTGLKTDQEMSDEIKYFLENQKLENFSLHYKTFFTTENLPRKARKKIASDSNLMNILENHQNLILEFYEKFNSYKICQDTSLLLRFVDKILEKYDKIKKENFFLDYNDLIVKANLLLSNPDFSDWVKYKMDGSFDHILIDESQDTNHQQWNIIKALSEDFFSGLSANRRNRTIFIVGDEKQSIYSFQGSDPNISQEIFYYFEEKLKSNPSNLQKIELNNSFRCLEKILEVVNKIFSSPQNSAAISKVSKFHLHHPIRVGKGFVEIWDNFKNEKKEKISQWDFASDDDNNAQKALANFISQKILDWVKNKRILEEYNRPVEYSDIMILLRNRTNGLDRTLSTSFFENKIPFLSFSKTNFSENLIIQDLTAAAKFALLQSDDLNLACLLKSYFFENAEDELIKICTDKNQHQTSIYKTLEDNKNYKSIYDSLQKIISKSKELGCLEFFYFLIQHENYGEKVAKNFGAKAKEIIDQFMLKILFFCESDSCASLQNFLYFAEELDPEISISLEENNAVKITTIHSAKGLEAPIVIIPDCCFNFNKMGNQKKISWIDFEENQFPIWCAGGKIAQNKIVRNFKEQQFSYEKDEYLRLLYVALTRAKNELYISGFGEDSNDSWCNICKS